MRGFENLGSTGILGAVIGTRTLAADAAIIHVMLTRAERRTLDDVLSGVRVEEAAARDWVTVNTVKFHRLNLYRKIGMSGGLRYYTREQIAERAEQLGIAA